MNILIDTVRIFGFRGVENVEIKLPKVTVLIGTNNSGKTSVIKALQLALGDYSRYLTDKDFHIDSEDVRCEQTLIDVRIIPGIDSKPASLRNSLTMDTVRQRNFISMVFVYM